MNALIVFHIRMFNFIRRTTRLNRTETKLSPLVQCRLCLTKNIFFSFRCISRAAEQAFRLPRVTFCCPFPGATQRRALPKHQSEETKINEIYHFLDWRSNSQPVVFKITHLCPSATTGPTKTVLTIANIYIHIHIHLNY